MNSRSDIPVPLNQKRLAEATQQLASIDKDMALILENHGIPPLWAREPGFTTLIRVILEQQVSQASADTMFRRLQANIDPLTATTVIAAGSDFLRSLGIT
ncbi:DNA-3-methyladenine glycosylase 2 family protein, partial [Pseudomonadota bacterium]